MNYLLNFVRHGLAAMLLIAAVAVTTAAPVELVSPNAETGSNFGLSVAGLDDVNSDGRGDVLIGAGSEDGATTPNIGRAYVFSGSTGILIRTLVSPNAQFNGRFGAGLCGYPDATGDGISEIAVGARGENSFQGRIYLFNGSSGALLQTIPKPDVVDPPSSSSFFGAILSGIPDVNDDGKGDVVASVQFYSKAAMLETGIVYIFDGSTGSELQDFSTLSNLDGFGNAIAGINDINSDGHGDVVIGAFSTYSTGSVPIYSGADGGLIRTLSSPDSGNNFGCSVSGVPDVSGDGVNDIVVGVEFEGTSSEGKAYIFNGANGNYIRTLVSPNAVSDGNFGSCVAGVPDTNSDGKGDVIVSAPGENISQEGRVYLIDGATGDVLATLNSTHPKSPVFYPFGCSLAGVPDANGDSSGDMIIGAPEEDVDSVDTAGRAYIFHGGTANVGQWRKY